jgi:hypothetical protein
MGVLVRKRLGHLFTLCLCALVFSGCERVGSKTPQGESSPSADSSGRSKLYGQPVRLAELEDRAVAESSGLVASRHDPNIFWTHNDSGDAPMLYAFDRKGKSKGRWRVTNAQAVDWEDIAAGPGQQSGTSDLYIGDIGDNGRKRDYITVYRVPEPGISSDDLLSGKMLVTEPAEAIRLKYPDGRHDAETLMVHPLTGDLYIVTKDFTSSTGVYKLKAPFSTASVNTLSRVAEISVPNLIGGLITGGDISPDGMRVVLCDYLSGYEIVLPGDAKGDFDRIWKEPMAEVELGPRKQGEAVGYSQDGNSILATSEKRPTPLIEVKRKRS